MTRSMLVCVVVVLARCVQLSAHARLCCTLVLSGCVPPQPAIARGVRKSWHGMYERTRVSISVGAVIVYLSARQNPRQYRSGYPPYPSRPSPWSAADKHAADQADALDLSRSRQTVLASHVASKHHMKAPPVPAVLQLPGHGTCGAR